eukprot:scaffold34071_cov48-Phaeocystis_antarctica.AAC.1
MAASGVRVPRVCESSARSTCGGYRAVLQPARPVRGAEDWTGRDLELGDGGGAVVVRAEGLGLLLELVVRRRRRQVAH